MTETPEEKPMTDQPTELVPHDLPELLADLPDPRELKAVIRERIQLAAAEYRAARGDVLQPEDTYDLQRRYQATRERLEQYVRAFQDAVKLVGQLQLEELQDAVGEQDGVPNSGLTIPTAGGDIVVKPDFERKNIIDPDQVRAVLAAQAARNLIGLDLSQVESVEMRFAELVDEAFAALIACGSWTPQITKVKATADAFARAGDDPMAAVLRGTISTRKVYKDRVAVERKAPK